jgi:CubicO group peptidase (beta-lactamase class C family)
MISKYLYVFTLSSCICFNLNAQTIFKVSYEDLKQYEGTYEYMPNTILQIVASPKDTLLYALIGDGKYKLWPSEKDIFLNGSRQEVHFVKNTSGQYGYQVKDETPDKFYKRISNEVTINRKMWFARDNDSLPFRWQYQIPKDLNDGLKTGSLIKTNLDTALIHVMMDRIVNGSYSDVHSILIMKDGKLVVEEYFYEYDVNTKHQLRSATKSFTSALVGISMDKLLIKHKDETLLSYFPEYNIKNPDVGKGRITVDHLLNQQSGFACDDDDGSSPGNEVKIYPTHDWIKSILDLPMASKPGQEAHYCSGNVWLLNRIIEKASRCKLHEFAEQNLFSKLGVKDFDWDFVPNESHQDSFSQLSLRPRDMMKFGQLYLNGGWWNGEQIISKNWVDATFTRQTSIRGLGYSHLWWCEDLTANGKVFRGMAAKGNGGQRIFIWPEVNMIAVVTAGNYNSQSPSNRLLIECVLGGLKK